MISKYSQNSSELENLMHESLNNKDELINIDNTINDLIRSAELFDELKNHKAAEIITKIIEKLAFKSGK